MIQSIGKKVLFSAINPQTLSSCATSCATCPSFSSCQTNKQSNQQPDTEGAIGVSSQSQAQVVDTQQYNHIQIGQQKLKIQVQSIRTQSLTDWAIYQYGK
ncbi:hypothetical protein SS50377_22145 [Spironucleus salmonicida]|uniref:Uncharacterized protein n=1 Tax=Spironucleus salmonicida TaxID=348837 RepID=V6LPR4_9EUKA|nr:hypothetical protein SS50377_22145 [Spironucleus salmonicida]|eukprot:EST45696.1 Hypothetical protein SS50377_14267 [Spironucleus salmonicida]